MEQLVKKKEEKKYGDNWVEYLVDRLEQNRVDMEHLEKLIESNTIFLGAIAKVVGAELVDAEIKRFQELADMEDT